jgi:hypothetical protein
MFSVEGSSAHTKFKKMAQNKPFTFWAITRMDGAQVLKAADDDSADPIKIPVEFVLLGIEN